METAPNIEPTPASPIEPPKEKTVKAPAFCTFHLNKNATWPMNGYSFKFVGYTDDWKLVFECVGMTGATRKALERGGKK